MLYSPDPLVELRNDVSHDNNLLYGFLIQFLWQAKSGRLHLSQQNGEVERCAISPKSWWAGVNYYLSVIPLLGAQKAGWNPILNAIRIKSEPFPSERKFLTQKDVSQLNDAQASLIDIWCLFFLKFQEMKRKAIQDEDSISELCQSMWNAHNASVIYATSILTEELALYSLDEQLFGSGWASLVGTFAELNPLVTTRKKTERANESMFPPRILKLHDDLHDFNTPQKEFVAFIKEVAHHSKLKAKL